MGGGDICFMARNLWWIWVCLDELERKELRKRDIERKRDEEKKRQLSYG